MTKRKHLHGSSASVTGSAPLDDAPAVVSAEDCVPVAIGFSNLLKQHLQDVDLELLRAAGFLDDADLAGLTLDELRGLCPSLSSIEAERALSVAAHHQRRQPVLEVSSTVVAPLPPSKPARRNASAFKPGPAYSLAITDSKTALLENSWQVYVCLADKGLKYSALY